MENIFVKEDNLCLTGDIHLGNPFFEQSKSFASFLDYLCDNNLSLCINGDGLDILQLSFAGISLDLPPILEHLELIASRGLKIYYIIGNHDIYLEKFWHRWKNFVIVPFLDVISGDKRIHIEHGHLYDNFFLNHPTAYTRLTVLVGFFLKISPPLYRIWDRCYNKFLGLLARRKHLTEEQFVDTPELIVGARDLLQRGFDIVVFGHSHCVGQLTMQGYGQYFNTGSWMRYPNHFVEIRKGTPELKTWK